MNIEYFRFIRYKESKKAIILTLKKVWPILTINIIIANNKRMDLRRVPSTCIDMQATIVIWYQFIPN